jgi:hypothetical protein
MRDKIGVAARANKRTMNAEIIQRLEASFSSWELRDSMQSLEAKVAGLEAKVAGLEAKVAELPANGGDRR